MNGGEAGNGGDTRRMRAHLATRQIYYILDELVKSQQSSSIKALCGSFMGKDAERLLINARDIIYKAPWVLNWHSEPSDQCFKMVRHKGEHSGSNDCGVDCWEEFALYYSACPSPTPDPNYYEISS